MLSDAIVIATNGDEHDRRNAWALCDTSEAAGNGNTDEHSGRTGVGVHEGDLLIGIVNRDSPSSPE